MITVFLSYSAKDHHFAELAGIRLGEAEIGLWRDQGRLRAGTDWQQGIERGISESFAVLVALSAHSAESPYVTYEWAYAMGQGKPIIPLKLAHCTVHPKLESIQYLDFSVAGALPWTLLIERIREIETENELGSPEPQVDSFDAERSSDAAHLRAILSYLNQRGYQMASFERLRQRIDESLTDERFDEIIANNGTLLRHAKLRGGKPGLAKRVP